MDSSLARRLFAAGAALGLGAAIVTALGPLKTGSDDAGVAARVGDGVVTTEALDRAMAALAQDKRNPVDDKERARVLDRLIDEEALVQRGIQLGLPESDLAVRKAIVDAMLQFAAAESAAKTPTDAELRAFYDSRPDLFRAEPALKLEAVVLPAYRMDAMTRIGAAVSKGAALTAAAAAEGGAPLPLPAAAIPRERIAGVAGPTVARIAESLKPGEVAGAAGDDGRLYIVRLAGAEPGARADFERVRGDVEEAWRRVENERAVDAYLAGLRRELRVRKAAP
ncbi:MAG: peptidyl-prolyl cis-trans isomerase [Alphaproteobacteria bacterium]|nr:peptidyl-prolyl cis-trans isomerase [Alphaproteobacteria bacterium]